MSGESPELRASHADRDRAVDVLRLAAGDGRLSIDELETRLEAALSARTVGELASLTSDLPTAVQAKEVIRIDQRFGSLERTGRWAVPRRIEMVPHFCHVTLDFTEAVVAYDSLRIDMDMEGRKLVLVTKPGMVLDADALVVEYGKAKLRPRDESGAPVLFRIELVGRIRHGRVVERFTSPTPSPRRGPRRSGGSAGPS
ncbi:DUF1707 domain-containing protein [Streptomyces sp. NPDC092296]|uniref:DUF1707 SHOCT-like domain-containing protein n=1 Tax=Streptomyces sp. NPDC092296 TaxID=3366012 RepID=UPI003813C247